MDANKSPVDVNDSNDTVSIPVTVNTASKSPAPAPLPVTPSVASAPVLPEEVNEVEQKPVESPVVEAVVSQVPEPTPTPVEMLEPTIKEDMPVAKPMGRSLQELAAEEEARNNPVPSEAPVENSASSKHKSRSPIVLVAALLVMALVGGGAFAYWQSNKKVTPAASTNTTDTTTKVKAADINQTSTDLDTSLKKVDDTKDYTTTDLADAALGL